MEWVNKLFSNIIAKIIFYTIIAIFIMSTDTMPLWIDQIGLLWMTKLNVLFGFTILYLFLILYQEHRKYNQSITPNDYEFNKKLGIWKNKKTNIYQCPIGMSKKIIAPLQELKHGWLCRNCGQFFENPDTPIPKPEFEETKSRWLNGFDKY